MENDFLIHSVIFNLKHESGSEAESRFLEDGRRILSSIPVVRDFNVFRQVSPKNDFSFGFSMAFASEDDFQAYNDHPLHVKFVNERWQTEVESFLEIDYRKLQ